MENKTKQKFRIKNKWLKAGIVALTLLTGASYAWKVHDVVESRKTVYAPEQSEAKAKKDLWARAVNNKGVLLTPEFLEQFPVYNEIERNESQEASPERTDNLRRIVDELVKEYKEFDTDTRPEKYTDKVFLMCYKTADHLKEFIDPDKVAEVFKLDKTHPIYAELERKLMNDDNNKIPEILYCSLMMVQKKMEPERVDSVNFPDFLENLEEGRGDCTDYSYAVANNYYKMCEMLGRKDLFSKIRIMFGFRANEDKLVARHAWIEYYQEKGNKREWKRCECVQSDRMNEDTVASLDEAVIYLPDTDSGILVPQISTLVEFDGKTSRVQYYAHILPNATGRK